jgi:hypothetical protein
LITGMNAVKFKTLGMLYQILGHNEKLSTINHAGASVSMFK